MRDLESLLLRMLPPYLRILNRQRGGLEDAQKVPRPDNRTAEPIDRTKLPPSY